VRISASLVVTQVSVLSLSISVFVDIYGVVSVSVLHCSRVLWFFDDAISVSVLSVIGVTTLCVVVSILLFII